MSDAYLRNDGKIEVTNDMKRREELNKTASWLFDISPYYALFQKGGVYTKEDFDEKFRHMIVQVKKDSEHYLEKLDGLKEGKDSKEDDSGSILDEQDFVI